MATKKVSYGVTAFIDILGMRERLKKAKDEKTILRIADELKKIQGFFDFRTKDPLTKEAQAAYSKTTLAFSDSIVIHLPLQSRMMATQGTFDPLMGELADFALNQAQCAVAGIFIRGAIDLGYWYRSGSRLVSESLMRAYEAEGQAEMPILVLTPQLSAFLENHAHRAFYAADIEPVSTLFRERTDAKGNKWPYLDYITIILESLDWHTDKAQLAAYRLASGEARDAIMNAGYAQNVNAWLSLHARKIEEAYQQAPEKAKDKYIWLAVYHNELAKKYTNNSSTVCSVP